MSRPKESSDGAAVDVKSVEENLEKACNTRNEEQIIRFFARGATVKLLVSEAMEQIPSFNNYYFGQERIQRGLVRPHLPGLKVKFLDVTPKCTAALWTASVDSDRLRQISDDGATELKITGTCSLTLTCRVRTSKAPILQTRSSLQTRIRPTCDWLTFKKLGCAVRTFGTPI